LIVTADEGENNRSSLFIVFALICRLSEEVLLVLSVEQDGETLMSQLNGLRLKLLG
jgi:hypothetical protein